MAFEFLNRPKKDTENSNKDNIQSITSSKASQIIKNLSGGEVKYSKKLADNVVVISNASGGTGASTITANVAYTAYKKGLRVLVIDLNLLLPSQHMYFGVKQELERPDLVGYLLGKNSLGDGIIQSNYASLLFANNRGLMDYINCESDQSIDNFKKAIEGLRSLFDLILIDCPMKVENTICNYAFYLADQIYLVWDEGISSIANTEKIRRNMASTGIDAYTKMKVILNKRTDVQYSEYPFNKLNIELVQYLPFEPDIIQSSLSSEIFCDKGASKSKNSGFFCGGIERLTDKILEMGGYFK